MNKVFKIIIVFILMLTIVNAKELDSIKISNDNNTIVIKWNKTDSESTYTISRSKKKNGKYKVVKTTKDNVFKDKKLVYGKTYYYKIKTSKITKTVSKKVIPNSVNNLIIDSVGKKNIKLTWDKQKVSGYEIYRSTDKKKWAKVGKTSKISFNNNKLKTNKTYYYKVRSYVKVNGKKVYSKFSNIVSAQTTKYYKLYSEAIDKAKNYIDKYKLSKEELLSKLKYNSIIQKYVLDKLNINFKENALSLAKKYESMFSLSKEELIKQLKEYEKFTEDEVKYAINNIKTEYGDEVSSIELKYKKDLSLLGYTDEEIEKIFEDFSTNEIKKYLLDKKYNNLLGFKSSEYFDIAKIDRYQNYCDKNKYSENECVLYVEIGLDNDFYTNMKKANTSDGKLILVNKYYYISDNYNANIEKLGSGYGIGSLNKEAAKHFREMVDAAKKDGIKLRSVSAYRSYKTQKSLYKSYVRRDGVKKADTYSARPGHSEHNTGLAVDINTASSSAHFEKTKEYKWLIDNSYKYGFALRYLKGKEFITGYKYEPWHFRYFGSEVATSLHELGVTYEEYLIMNKK